MINQTQETTLETLARKLQDRSQTTRDGMDGKSSSYLKKMFDFVTGKKDILEKKEGK